jgi:hypothetical protein
MRTTSQRPLSFHLQAVGLSIFSGRSSVEGETFTWDGELVPTGASSKYQVRIILERGYYPRSYLVSPSAREMADSVIPNRNLPHVYVEEPLVQMCVFRPSKREWNSRMSLALTVVPWMSLWLSFFEDWVITDEWSGGGEHPSEADIRQHAEALPE